MPNASRFVRGGGRGTAVVLGLGAVSILFTACSIHITKNGISGNIAGHSFSATAHALPSGFPTDVPLPDNARVIGGAGTNGGYDAVFAVPGTVTDGARAYASKFQAGGYTVTNITAPATTEVPASGQNSSSTTVTLSGSSFTAKNSSWTVQVEMGSSSSAVGSELKAGEFGVNITVVPASTSTTG